MKPEDRLLYGTVNGFVENGKVCFIGNNELAKRVGCSVRTVQRYLTKLVGMGLLSVVKRTVDGKTQRTINVVKKDSVEIATLLGFSLDETVEVVAVPNELDTTIWHPPHDRLSPPPRQSVTPPMTDCHPKNNSNNKVRLREREEELAHPIFEKYNSEQIEEAFTAWAEHQAAIGKTFSTTNKQAILKQASKLGCSHDALLELIEVATAQGWKSIRWEKDILGDVDHSHYEYPENKRRREEQEREEAMVKAQEQVNQAWDAWFDGLGIPKDHLIRNGSRFFVKQGRTPNTIHGNDRSGKSCGELLFESFIQQKGRDGLSRESLVRYYEQNAFVSYAQAVGA